MSEQEKPKVRVLFPQGTPPDAVPSEQQSSSPAGTAVSPVSKPVVKPLFPAEAIPNLPVVAAKGPAALHFEGMVVRRRLEVSTEQLKLQSPDVVSDDSFQKAAEAIRIVNLDDPQSTKFLDFGVSAQQRFAEIAQQILNVTTTPVIDRTRHAVRVMADLIAATNPEQLFKTPSGFARFFEARPNFEQARQSLLQCLGEIKNRSKLIQHSLGELNGVSQTATTLHGRLTASLVDVEGVLVAARFLVDYLRRNQSGKTYFAEWAELLERRVSSVLTTRLTLLQAFKQLEVLQKSLAHFTETVNHVLVNLIPAWHGSCVAALTNTRFDHHTASSQSVDVWRNLAVLRNQILKLLRMEEREKNANEIRS
jgi:hypothetical protein